MLVKEKLSLYDFADRFLNLQDMKTPRVINIENLGIKILTIENGKKCYKPMTHFIVKSGKKEYYTDGNIKVSEGHVFIEDNKEIFAQEHKDFKKINSPLDVVDVTVDETHSYLANGRLNHNSPASGGMAANYYAHVQVRLNQIGKIKNKVGLIVGAKNKAVVRKTRLGPPWREAEYETYFDSGIDDKKACLEILEKYKVIKKGGAYKKWNEKLSQSTFGELTIDYETNFQLADWRIWMENEEFYKYISQKIAEFSISKYKGFMGKDEEVELEETEAPLRDLDEDIVEE